MAAKQETPSARLKKAKSEKQYWYGMARMETASLSRTLKKIAEVELICAELESEIRETRKTRETRETTERKRNGNNDR